MLLLKELYWYHVTAKNSTAACRVSVVINYPAFKAQYVRMPDDLN